MNALPICEYPDRASDERGPPGTLEASGSGHREEPEVHPVSYWPRRIWILFRNGGGSEDAAGIRYAGRAGGL